MGILEVNTSGESEVETTSNPIEIVQFPRAFFIDTKPIELDVIFDYQIKGRRFPSGNS